LLRLEKSPMNFLQRRRKLVTLTQTPSANSKVKCMLMALELVIRLTRFLMIH
jgi:hypothetical protein